MLKWKVRKLLSLTVRCGRCGAWFQVNDRLPSWRSKKLSSLTVDKLWRMNRALQVISKTSLICLTPTRTCYFGTLVIVACSENQKSSCVRLLSRLWVWDQVNQIGLLINAFWWSCRLFVHVNFSEFDSADFPVGCSIYWMNASGGCDHPLSNPRTGLRLTWFQVRVFWSGLCSDTKRQLVRRKCVGNCVYGHSVCVCVYETYSKTRQPEGDKITTSWPTFQLTWAAVCNVGFPAKLPCCYRAGCVSVCKRLPELVEY